MLFSLNRSYFFSIIVALFIILVTLFQIVRTDLTHMKLFCVKVVSILIWLPCNECIVSSTIAFNYAVQFYGCLLILFLLLF